MTFHSASSFSLSLFSLFSLIMFVTILRAFKKAKVAKQIQAVFAIYIVALSIVVLSGVARQYVIPFLPLVFFSTMGLTFYMAFSKTGRDMMNTFNLVSLIAFQGFRLPLELILHQWAETETIPQTMTWTGQNIDIVAGLISLLSIPLVRRSRAAAWCVQSVCFLLLLNVLRVVVMSSPLPFSWNLDNPLQLGLEFPYILIVPLFVAPALFGHLIVFRKLWNQKGSN